MQHAKVRSFTLSELLVVMIITVIVVGIAFSVLSLVQRQIKGIEKNFSRTTELSLIEQRLWQDFDLHNNISYHGNKLILISDTDTVQYAFNENFTLRNNDTIPLKVSVKKSYYLGREVSSGNVDAISVSGDLEVPDHSIFVSSQHDAAHFMNQNGL